MDLDPDKIPRHIAIIMDGNGRWAANRGLPRIAGHRAGADSVHEIVKACHEVGVEYLTLYAFSWENWNRPQPEVEALMSLLEQFLQQRTQEMLESNVKLETIGRTHLLPEPCRRQLQKSMDVTAKNDGITLVLALSYGGREEILDAVRSVSNAMASGQLQANELSADIFSRHLYTHAYPDPDLMIRTSGEMRLSNFLLWQLSYAEFVVTDTLWPDFRKADLHCALREYASRHRRFGGV